DVIARQDPRLLNGWVLAEGTGLALQIGHRRSEDFDFFRDTESAIPELHARLRALGTCEALREGPRDLTLLTQGVKVSFFVVSEPFLHPTHRYRSFEIADSREIALMKLVAISGRGSRKDFVDLFFLIRGGCSLEALFAELPRKYGEGRVNAYHVLRSLTYFDDAEEEPALDLLEPFDWEECKRFFVREASAIVLP
ncbi:MAG TPA: nucleotidyl transferase AbiEii/AbiGii toxin family protein, partial [Vicinamibacteria bacterium]